MENRKLVQQIFDIGVDQKELLLELKKASKNKKSVAKMIREAIDIYIDQDRRMVAMDVIDKKIALLKSYNDSNIAKTVILHLQQLKLELNNNA